MRFTLILAACLALVGTHVLGLHSHISHWDDGDSAEQAQVHHHAAQGERITAAEIEGARDHLVAHLDHGDTDLDEPSMSGRATSILKAPVAFIGVVCVPLALVPVRTAAVLQPPLRPPEFRSRRQLLPPPHAPPLTA